MTTASSRGQAQRYDIEMDFEDGYDAYWTSVPSASGEWVKVDDYDALATRCETAEYLCEQGCDAQAKVERELQSMRLRCERLEAALQAVNTEWTSFWPSGPDGDDHGPRVAMIAEETRVIWRQIRLSLRAGEQHGS